MRSCWQAPTEMVEVSHLQELPHAEKLRIQCSDTGVVPYRSIYLQSFTENINRIPQGWSLRKSWSLMQIIPRRAPPIQKCFQTVHVYTSRTL